jgi:hypothetical protein
MRKVPNLVFFIDDSLDYIEKIDNALANRDNRQQRPSRQTQISIKNFPFIAIQTTVKTTQSISSIVCQYGIIVADGFVCGIICV